MEKPINPKIDRAELEKLVVKLDKTMETIRGCRKAATAKIFKQLRYEMNLKGYKEAMAHEKMIRTIFRMRKAGSTFAEIGKKVGKNRREVGAIYRKVNYVSITD